jgi:hypothetical protein
MTDQEMLDAAKLARHQLLMGQSVVECDFGGVGSQQRTRFTAANADRLDAYIAELESRVAGLPTRGAVGFIF